jgi:hypothetical protein
MDIEKSHSFSKEEALERLQSLTDYWQKHGVSSSWDGSQGKIDGKVKGFSFQGEIRVEERRVLASVKANFIARKAGGAYVKGKLEDYLDPKNSLESLKARV